MNESPFKNTNQESSIELRPFVSRAENATPSFEVLAWSDQPMLDTAPGLLAFLDNCLPAIYRGKTCLSFSLDGGEVFNKSFPKNLMEKVELKNINPSRLWLEVCESAVMSKTASQMVIPALAESGFRVVIKRFIADHSDFDILASPHISGIKVAAPVTAQLPGSVLARRFLKGLQTLTKAVNKQLVVDGVETLGQALWLEAMGCDMFQGPYYSPAIEVRSVRSFVFEERQMAAPIMFKPVTD